MTAVSEKPEVKAPVKKSTGRKATRRTTTTPNSAVAESPYQAPTDIRPPEEFKVREPEAIEVEKHPVYGDKKLYTYQPKDGSEAIVFPHISTCQPDALFFYENRRSDEMHQAFAWMDLCGIPTVIGRRLFLLPDDEQAVLLREWFGGLNLTPAAGVSPPGES